MPDRSIALVTGANKGLGKETVRRLADHGMTVLLGSRDRERGESAAAELARHGTVIPVRLDVTDPDGIAAVAARLQAEYGRLDVLVNNAGTVMEERAVDLTGDAMRDVFQVNVFGVVDTIHAMLPLLRHSGDARIVNVSSTTASLNLTGAGTDFGGDPGRRVAYTSSKAALNMLTLQYSRAFAMDPELRHIRVNSVTPGYTATDLTGHRGTRSVAEGARVIVELATSAENGPTGGFYNDQGPVPW